MTTRKQLADWIERGHRDPKIIVDPFICMLPNLRRQPNGTEAFETTCKVSVYDARMRRIGESTPLYTLVADVIGLALVGLFGSPETAWQQYCAAQFPVPKRWVPDKGKYTATAKLLGVKNSSVRRLVCFHTGMSTVDEIVGYLRSGDPVLFATDDL